MKILLVEDSLMQRRLLTSLLEMEGYTEVTSVTNAEEAFRTLGLGSGHAPATDLILLDLNLPDMDGIQAMRRIKADAHTRQLPVIILTASDDAQDIQNAQQAGAFAIAHKPPQIDELVKLIQRAVKTK